METNLLRARVGQKVESFQTHAYMPDGNFQIINLQEHLDEGKWIILFFWPLDFTTVCPTEIRSMSDNIKKFERENTQILGISTDSKNAHKAWCEQDIKNGGLGRVKFPLLEDLNHNISRYFDVLVEKEGIALRGTFIISPDGILQSSVINNTNVGRSTDEILRTLAAFRTGSLCPMNWHEGDHTL